MKELARLTLKSTQGQVRTVTLSEGDYVIGADLGCDLVFLDQSIAGRSIKLGVIKNSFRVDVLDAQTVTVQTGNEEPNTLSSGGHFIGYQSCDLQIDNCVLLLELYQSTELLVIPNPEKPPFYERLCAAARERLQHHRKLTVSGVVGLVFVSFAFGVSEGAFAFLADALNPTVVGPVRDEGNAAPSVAQLFGGKGTKPGIEPEAKPIISPNGLQGRQEPDPSPRRVGGDTLVADNGKRDPDALKASVDRFLASLGQNLSVSKMSGGEVFLSGFHRSNEEMEIIRKKIIRKFDFIKTVYFADVDNVKNERMKKKIIGVSWEPPKFVVLEDKIVGIGGELDGDAKVIGIEEWGILIEDQGKITRISVKG